MSESTGRPELSWVVPMYRTSEFVEELCARIAAISRTLGLDAELVLVDDACPEDSAGRAERVNCPLPLHVIRLERNNGQDAAILAGLRVCKGRYAVILDADLQDPPEAVRLLWPSMEQGFDAVFANRFGTYEARGRLVTSRLYRTAVRHVGRLPPGAGLFVLMNRRVIDAIVATHTPRTSILAAIVAAGGRYTSVPVERAARRHGGSAYASSRRVSKALRSLWQIAVARFVGVS